MASGAGAAGAQGCQPPLPLGGPTGTPFTDATCVANAEVSPAQQRAAKPQRAKAI